MRRPDLVDVDAQLREAPREHARRPRVVQVDVREQERPRLRLDSGEERVAHDAGPGSTMTPGWTSQAPITRSRPRCMQSMRFAMA